MVESKENFSKNIDNTLKPIEKIIINNEKISETISVPTQSMPTSQSNLPVPEKINVVFNEKQTNTAKPLENVSEPPKVTLKTTVVSQPVKPIIPKPDKTIFSNQENKINIEKNLNSEISPTSPPPKSFLTKVYSIMIFVCVILVFVLVLIYLFDRKNNLTRVDNVNYNTSLYNDWMEGNTEISLTLTIPVDLINHKVYLNIKNNIKVINVILPKAVNLLEFNTLQLYVPNTKNNVSFTYYLYEDDIDSIFQTNTYFINTQYNKASLKVVKNAERNLVWSIVGAGILENI